MVRYEFSASLPKDGRITEGVKVTIDVTDFLNIRAVMGDDGEPGSSVRALVVLTVPAVVAIGLVTGQPVVLGIDNASTVVNGNSPEPGMFSWRQP